MHKVVSYENPSRTIQLSAEMVKVLPDGTKTIQLSAEIIKVLPDGTKIVTYVWQDAEVDVIIAPEPEKGDK